MKLSSTLLLAVSAGLAMAMFGSDTGLADVDAISTQMLAPLYEFPVGDAWNPIYTAASTYPNVTSQAVVNPNSGPGSSQYPQPAYITAISKLNTYPNVQLLGYVHVGYGKRPAADVRKDIDIYAGWTGYKGGNIAVTGIFFDETASSGSSDMIAYMSALQDYTRSKLGGDAFTVYNMGTKPGSTVYYDQASLIIVFENSYANYKGLATINSVVPSGYASQSAIVLHDFTGTQANMDTFVKTAVAANIGSVYMTGDCCYNTLKGPKGGPIQVARALAVYGQT